MELNRRQFIEVAAAAVPLVPLEMSGPQNDRGDPDNPLGVRRDFPVVREGLYLNSAYIAPVPVPVADAARLFAERKVTKPIALDEMLQKTGEVRRQLFVSLRAHQLHGRLAALFRTLAHHVVPALERGVSHHFRIAFANRGHRTHGVGMIGDRHPIQRP